MPESDEMECATCGMPAAALDLVHGDGVCAICGASATNPATPEPVMA